ncbi:cytochrome c3 family protein [uncultured Desulfuromusa sp.]|uniref:cytochrome c3 family protein n=1 Tax=uncultured Desulfuromusa sp. TaxID=219183 RepID=UPI002AA82A8B|nr:cytochrome c3 family protein [uncultured Desulfuromusa sp.]
MKTVMIVTLTVFVGLLFSSTTFAGIAGSAHDLSAEGLGTDQICKFCHTPHHAKVDPGDYNPLWNMDVPDSAAYTSYSSSTFMDGATISDPLVGPSRLCMSCHDGTIAIDNAINPSSTTYIDTRYPATTANLDQDLSNDHPVGFDYVAAQGLDDELYPASTDFAGGTISDYLFGDIMTCASCHDVHDGDTGKFLLVGNSGSALCLSCHIK